MQNSKNKTKLKRKTFITTTLTFHLSYNNKNVKTRLEYTTSPKNNKNKQRTQESSLGNFFATPISPKPRHLFTKAWAHLTASQRPPALPTFFFLSSFLGSQNKNFSGNFSHSFLLWFIGGPTRKANEPKQCIQQRTKVLGWQSSTNRSPNKQKHTKQKNKQNSKVRKHLQKLQASSLGLRYKSPQAQKWTLPTFQWQRQVSLRTKQAQTTTKTQNVVLHKNKDKVKTQVEIYNQEIGETSPENKPNAQQQNNELTEIQKVRDQQNNLRNNFTATSPTSQDPKEELSSLTIFLQIGPSATWALLLKQSQGTNESISLSQSQHQGWQKRDSKSYFDWSWRWGLDHSLSDKAEFTSSKGQCRPFIHLPGVTNQKKQEQIDKVKQQISKTLFVSFPDSLRDIEEEGWNNPEQQPQALQQLILTKTGRQTEVVRVGKTPSTLVTFESKEDADTTLANGQIAVNFLTKIYLKKAQPRPQNILICRCCMTVGSHNTRECKRTEKQSVCDFFLVKKDTNQLTEQTVRNAVIHQTDGVFVVKNKDTLLVVRAQLSGKKCWRDLRKFILPKNHALKDYQRSMQLNSHS